MAGAVATLMEYDGQRETWVLCEDPIGPDSDFISLCMRHTNLPGGLYHDYFYFLLSKKTPN